MVLSLLLLTALASAITIIINHDAIPIAMASVAGFTAAQVVAGIAYQLLMQKAFFAKVNGTDLLAVIIDSIIFQIIAFGGLHWNIVGLQVALKSIGGLVWYIILFKKYKIHEKFNRS